MPYVDRDSAGKIHTAYNSIQYAGQEFVADDNEDVKKLFSPDTAPTVAERLAALEKYALTADDADVRKLNRRIKGE